MPPKVSPSTPQAARQLKAPGLESNSISSPNSPGRMSKSRSPKAADRRSPQGTTLQGKKKGRITELESQLVLLHDELKKVREKLISAEAQKKQAQVEAEEIKNQLTAMSAKLDESQQQLLELSASEDTRIQELRKISHERDLAWQSENEAFQRQHSMGSVALSSAMNEIQKLKKQLELLGDSEVKKCKYAESAYPEIHGLRIELSEALVLLEKMKHQLDDCAESEARARAMAATAQKQLNEVISTSETFRSDGLKTIDACDQLEIELEQSKNQVSSLEMLVSKLQAELYKNCGNTSENGSIYVVKHNQETQKVRAEIESLKIEVGHLKSNIDASEIRYRNEYIQSALDIRNAYAEVERAKSESALREAQLKEELKTANSMMKELKSEPMSKIKKQTSSMKSGTSAEHNKLAIDLEDLETQMQHIIDGNEMLKMEIKEGENKRSKSVEVADALAKVTKEEDLMKLGNMIEEADRSKQKAARIAEQLDAAQTLNMELDVQLRRLKVQSDQWRKAAEAAAAMLSPERNDKFVDKSVSLDNDYHAIHAKMDSPFSDEIDDESPKKKNGNMLKKIGDFLKKGQM